MSDEQPARVPGICHFRADGPIWVSHCGRRLHQVPFHIVAADLAGCITRQIEGPSWFAVVPLADGQVICRGSGPGVTAPPQEAFDRMFHVAIALNAGNADVGHWVTAYDHALKEIVGLWRDADGDLHVVIDWPMADMLQNRITKDDMVAGAVAALAEQQRRESHLELAANQTIKATLGQRSRDVH